MKRINGDYVRDYDRKHDRKGTLWCGRYGAILIEDERYWLTCLLTLQRLATRRHTLATSVVA